MTLEIAKLLVGPIQTNCYIVRLKESGEAIVVDPGGNVAKVVGRLHGMVAGLEAILITHGHPDHIGAAGELRAETGARIFIGAGDAYRMDDLRDEYGMLAEKPKGFRSADVKLSKDEELSAAGIDIRVLQTPGHTEGGVSYLLSDYGVLFSGDTLFFASVGRTDLRGGSFEQLRGSIIDVLFKLPDTTRVLPGHGPETTIAREKGRITSLLNTI